MNLSMSNDSVTQYQQFQKLVAAAGQPNREVAIPSAREAIYNAAKATIEAAATRIRLESNYTLSAEQSVVEAVNRNPALYDQYLQAHPAQTGGPR